MNKEVIVMNKVELKKNNILTVGLFPWKRPGNWFYNFKQLSRNLHYANQRIKYGASSFDGFAVDENISTSFRNALAFMINENRESVKSTPLGFDSYDEWEKVLISIINDIDNFDDGWEKDSDSTELVKIKNSCMDKVKEHWFDLWW